MSALLADLFQTPASVYVDMETRIRTVSVFVRTVGREDQRRLRERLKMLGEAGLDLGQPRISISRLRAQDWAESWKRHFQPLEIAQRLLVRPSWSRRRAKRGQAVVVLDPGLSFGTGQHPTTRFCLRQIADSRGVEGQSFLDIGTGSGILAIAAAKLGYSPVEAFDFDPTAVRIARQNAGKNHAQLRLRQCDLAKLALKAPRQFNLVCANLTCDLLTSEREKIVARVRPDGKLVLAGILNRQFPAVRRAFTSMGMRVLQSDHTGEWTSAAFAFATRKQGK